MIKNTNLPFVKNKDRNVLNVMHHVTTLTSMTYIDLISIDTKVIN